MHAVSQPSTPATPSGQTVVLSEHAKNSTVHVQVGAKVKLLLHSTYWRIQPSAHPSVLAEDGQPRILPPVHSCPPGVGCAPVEAMFTADSPGTVVLTASRTACGEALACVGTAGRYQVTIVITR